MSSPPDFALPLYCLCEARRGAAGALQPDVEGQFVFVLDLFSYA